MPDDEIEAESRATDRLTLFSDAVVAIAITLRQAVVQPDPRLRAVDPGLLRNVQRLGDVDRRPAGGIAVASHPPPQARPRGRPEAW
jgi:hypothetical protein